jgi:hypothetical protein
MITDEELAAHPDPRVRPGICGHVATHTAAGLPLRIERVCISPPHDGPEPRPPTSSRDIYYPPAERHTYVTRWPNRDPA